MIKDSIEKGVSILICTYNGAQRLEPTLKALLSQQRTEDIPWEVVLVDNASSDNTSEAAKSLWKGSSIPFTLLSEPNPGRDNALRTGFKNVRYEYVCNVDDDTWVCSDYVWRVWTVMTQHPEVAVCGGKGFGEFEVEPPVWLKPLETALAIGPQGEKEGYVSEARPYLFGACAVYRKSLWNMLQESNFQFFLSGRKGKKLNSGEDFELCQAWKLAGYKLWYNPDITFRHYMPASRLTWKYFRKLYRAFGRSDLVSIQYLNAQGLFSPPRSTMINGYSSYLFLTLFQIIKKIPKYLTSLIFSNTGNTIILDTEREFALLSELLCNRRKYFSVKKTLVRKQWVKDL